MRQLSFHTINYPEEMLSELSQVNLHGKGIVLGKLEREIVGRCMQIFKTGNGKSLPFGLMAFGLKIKGYLSCTLCKFLVPGSSLILLTERAIFIK
jgi:hypothetical protein